MESELFKVEKHIRILHGQKVILDRSLSDLYQVTTKALIQAVKRNIERFPDDFMFQLSSEELENWRSQIVTSNDKAKMSLRRPPYAFTEHGVAMLSSVLRSKRAIQVNIEIMRAFSNFRSILMHHKELSKKLEELEKKYNYQFKVVFEAIRNLITEEKAQTKHPIGFKRS